MSEASSTTVPLPIVRVPAEEPSSRPTLEQWGLADAALHTLGLTQTSARCLLLIPMLEAAWREEVMHHPMFELMLQGAVGRFGLCRHDTARLRWWMCSRPPDAFFDRGVRLLLDARSAETGAPSRADLLEALVWAQLVNGMARDPAFRAEETCRSAHTLAASRTSASVEPGTDSKNELDWFGVWLALEEEREGLPAADGFSKDYGERLATRREEPSGYGDTPAAPVQDTSPTGVEVVGHASSLGQSRRLHSALRVGGMLVLAALLARLLRRALRGASRRAS